ncbi:MAG: phosphotransferase [Woeseiaceae bacterium]|nr:phosphotransferase [Woeseiaceae bacterium]
MGKTDIPLDKLGTYLEKNINYFHSLTFAKKFKGGQSNPTYLLTAGSGQYVLRRKPFGKLLQSAHAVEREFRVMSALRDSDVPVPHMIHLCEDEDVIGAVFFVMSYVEGRHFWNASLPELGSAARANIYDEMNRVLAALHSVDVEAAGLGDYGQPGSYFERQVSRWTGQYRASQTEDIPAMETLIEWLPANMPPDDGRSSLIHGDYRLDNMLFAKTEDKALALLDWELSTLGHPFADLAYQCMQLRLPQDSPVMGLAGLDRRALGIPTEEEYIARYCERTGLGGIPDWTFYLMFSFFRLAAILQGVLKRAMDGNASSTEAFKFGAMAGPLAAIAVQLLDGDHQ